MPPLPDVIETERELDELLSRPTERLAAFLGRLEGDLIVLGAGGKIGPTLARMARRAMDASGGGRQVYAVDVPGWGGGGAMADLAAAGARTIECDLLDPAAVERLPRCPNVMFLAGRKFGSTGGEHLTWAMNVIVPHHVARTFAGSRIVAFSTGCVYPLVTPQSGGASETTPPAPVGEYAMSCLGRERVFDYFSRTAGLEVLLFRLNYAVELRYGVLADVAGKVLRGEPVDVTTGWANVLWQGDVCERALLCLDLAASPPKALNVTGPEIISIRRLAEDFGRLLGRQPILAGSENGLAFLADAGESIRLFGPPSVSLERVICWTADWVRRGMRNLGKPTHFEVQDGRF